MRLLYLHQYFSTDSGAVGTRSYEVARRLAASGHEVTVVCGSQLNGKSGLETPFINGRREGDVAGFKVVEFEVPYQNKMGFPHRLAAFLRFSYKTSLFVLRQPADLVFATSTPLTIAIPALAARILRGRRYVFEVRDVWPELPKAMGAIRNPVILAMMRMLERAAYWGADGIVGLSPGIVDSVRKTAGLDKPIELVPNASDVELFGAENIEPKRLEGVGQHDFVALFTGTHGLANGLDAVLDAAATLKAHPDPLARKIKMVLVGDGQMKAGLVERAKRENLDNCVFHAPIAKRELARVLRGADVGLMILRDVPEFQQGTSPNKFFDYIAGGKPVVINYPGWLAQSIDESGCGVSVPPGQADLFARALVQLAADPESCTRMGRNSARLAREGFNRDTLVMRLAEFLERFGPEKTQSDRIVPVQQ
jgi:glycosyltransferase involved in cell wall biosynthesis